MIEVYGSSDDLIEVEGEICDEFPYDSSGCDTGDLLAFSDGTVLRIQMLNVWRITLVHPSQLGNDVSIVQCPENDEVNYSDRAVISGPGEIQWVVRGDAIAPAPRFRSGTTQ
jgi:hypothetical protein